MPELPEVETIRTQLESSLPFHIQKVKSSPESVSIIKQKDFPLRGQTIESIQRKGKLLIFNLEQNRFLLSHLGMTGNWRMTQQPLTEKHTHLELKSAQGTYLSYNDPRRFGNMYWLKGASAKKKIAELGPDLLSSEIDESYIVNALKRFPEKPLKVLLLDQKLFAGMGNYLANEVCARAGIRPTKKAKLVRRLQAKNILQGLHSILDDSLKTGGVTFGGGYKDAHGDAGKGVQNLTVFYQKICQLCKETPIKKITLAQRGTYYCPACQH